MMEDNWTSYGWYQIERCEHFLSDLDSCSEKNETTLPIKLDVPAMTLEHLFWCVNNCTGNFHRCRVDRWKEEGHINLGGSLGIMAFENREDAIMFRLRWGMEEDYVR